MSLNRAPICAQCGSLNCQKVEVETTDGPSIRLEGYLCEVCFTNAIALHQDLKRQFDELLALGVNRLLANEVLIDRIERLKVQAPQVAT
jgi:hypothetical protein